VLQEYKYYMVYCFVMIKFHTINVSFGSSIEARNTWFFYIIM